MEALETFSELDLEESPRFLRDYFRHSLPGNCRDEHALILAARQGDLESFNHLVLTYQDALFTTAQRILGDDEPAADATQDAFISAFRRINSFRGGSFKAWLMRIVTNACYDDLRCQKRHRTVPLDPINNEYDDMETSNSWQADTNLLPEETVENIELEHAIHLCLQIMPIGFRTVIVLVDIQGMNYHEAANAMRVPLGTIKSRLARARLRLRNHLQEFREFLPAKFQREKQGFL